VAGSLMFRMFADSVPPAEARRGNNAVHVSFCGGRLPGRASRRIGSFLDHGADVRQTRTKGRVSAIQPAGTGSPASR
jgi:hypothetical protein